VRFPLETSNAPTLLRSLADSLICCFESTSLTVYEVQRPSGSNKVRQIRVERCSRDSMCSFATLTMFIKHFKSTLAIKYILNFIKNILFLNYLITSCFTRESNSLLYLRRSIVLHSSCNYLQL